MELHVGDRVAYSIQFCQSIGCITGDLPRKRGEVILIKHSPGLPSTAYVKWTDGTIDKVLETNLAVVGLNSRFAAC